MAAPTSYQAPPAEYLPTIDFFERQESLRMGRYPAVVLHFSRDREVYLEDGETADTNVLGGPLYAPARLGGKYTITISADTPEGANRLLWLLNRSAELFGQYQAAGGYPAPGLALEAALANAVYELRLLALEATDAAGVAALGVSPGGDHPFPTA